MHRPLTPQHDHRMYHVRRKIEAMHSIFSRMRMQRLHAVTQLGFGIKVYLSLLAHSFRILLLEHTY